MTEKLFTGTLNHNKNKNKNKTKDTDHIRRSKSQIGNSINFSSDMTLDMKKDLFLANPQNKQRFIVSLREKFAEHKIRTLQAEGDADIFIVQTAVECAEKIK